MQIPGPRAAAQPADEADARLRRPHLIGDPLSRSERALEAAGVPHLTHRREVASSFSVRTSSEAGRCIRSRRVPHRLTALTRTMDYELERFVADLRAIASNAIDEREMLRRIRPLVGGLALSKEWLLPR